MSRRVVISGLGAVTGFGCGVQALWDALYEGRSCLKRISRFDPSGFPCQAAGEALDFSARDHVPKHYRKAVKVMARDIELAVGAAKAAVEDAGIVTRGTLNGETESPAAPKTTYPPARVGCQIGAGLIAAEIPELAFALASAVDEKTGRADAGGFSYEKWGESGMHNLTPLWLLKYLPNMLACHVTIIHEACGPSNTITCAEASGLLSIGESLRVIQRGDADLCFAGGAESKVNHMGLMRMHMAGRVAPARIDPGQDGAWRHVRPYDPEATGGLLGEGAGIALLESLDTAKQRGARNLVEVLGFGAACGPVTGDLKSRSRGLASAVRRALQDSSTNAGEIDAIVPHASGVRSEDEAEAAALHDVFADRLGSIPLVTLTPAVGDTMAGAGGLSASVGAMCIRRQALPARLHAGKPASGLAAGASKARDARLRRVLVCTGSMGGQNAAVVLGALNEN